MQTYTRHLTTVQFFLFNENTLPTNFYPNHGPNNLYLKKEGAGIILSPVANLFLIFKRFHLFSFALDHLQNSWINDFFENPSTNSKSLMVSS